MKKRKKKKISTSKLLVGIICGFGMAMTIFYYVTIWMGFDVDPAVAVAGITEIVSSVLGYLVFSLKTKQSRNENGLDKNGVPWTLVNACKTKAEEAMDNCVGGDIEYEEECCCEDPCEEESGEVAG